MNDNSEFTESIGNIFADLDLPNPEERLLKADLAYQIKQLLDADGLTPDAAASRLAITLQRLEELRLGRLAGISVNELLQYVTRLGRHVQVEIAA